MNASQRQIDELVEWLSPRLETLITHGANVRRILDAAKRPDQILESAMKVVEAEEGAKTGPPLKPEEMEVWKAMLPLLAEHSMMAVLGGGQSPDPDKSMTKQEAADYLGFSERKLEQAMKKRQIAYEKYGTGQTATVRFRRTELEKYRASRMVPARQNQV